MLRYCIFVGMMGVMLSVKGEELLPVSFSRTFYCIY